MTRLRSALWLPIFDDLAEPAVVARLATEAEDAGWHGVFVWDHLRWRAPVRQVADPWITLAAIATTTERLRFGPMVTPLARRRPAKVAKETATLDRLSGGRLTLGVGLGSDRFGDELRATGEELDDRRRAQMLDESLEILAAAWSGEPVHHHSRHYTVDGISFLPRPVQQPGVPVWAAGLPGNVKPLRRAGERLELTDSGRALTTDVTEAWFDWLLEKLKEDSGDSAAFGDEGDVRAALRRIVPRVLLERQNETISVVESDLGSSRAEAAPR